MSEENKANANCSNQGCGCGPKGGCCKGVKLIVLLLVAGFIFAAGMWFAKSQCSTCSMSSHHNFCPLSEPGPK